MDEKRRLFLLGTLVLFSALTVSPACAEDGDSDGGGSNSGSGGGGSDDGEDGGSDDNSNSDDNDNKDDDRDDDKDDDNDGDKSSPTKGDKREKDQERARAAVSSGKVASLRKLKSHLQSNYKGKVISIDLKRQFGRFVYRVKLLEKGNRVKSLTLDGMTLQPRLM